MWHFVNFFTAFCYTDKAEKFIAEAAGNGSQLLVFPEAFIGGYPHGCTFGLAIGNRTAKGKEDFRKYHAAAIEVPGNLQRCQCIHVSISS